jgi:TPR repeat protein
VNVDLEDLRRKAESGNRAAQCVLGICYLDGVDVEADYKKAFRYLSEAAEGGVSRAVVNLARMYEEGLGIPQDMQEAIRLYKCVAKVELLAAVELGRIYSRGLSVPVDHNEAATWYRIAADHTSEAEEIVVST